MAEFTYRAIQVLQQPGAPAFYMTAAPASEVLEWSDVPRAKGQFMAGYQRPLNDKRVEDLADYIRRSAANVVPGAVIVAIDEDYVTVVEDEPGFFTLHIRGDERDFATQLQELFGAFSTRLSEEELSSAEVLVSKPEGAGGGEELSAESAVEVQEEEEKESEEEEESEYPISYLAQVAKELQAALVDWDALPKERQDAIRDYIGSVAKPGLIIDGQHRVFGAKNVSEHDVNLPLVILPGLEFAEQVFQFYVLNSKATALKPTELRRIVSTSLTNEEIERLYERFRAAGIEANEARWTLTMNQAPSSPFHGLIDFGFGNQGAVIPENVADQVVRGFMKMPRAKYRQLTDPLGEQWTNPDRRLEVFFWFWGAVKDYYKDLWEEAEASASEGVKDQLFMKAALLTLQSFLLKRFVTALPYRGAGEPPPLSSRDELARMVASTLTNLPAEFFQREWKMKQIDTAEGRKELEGTMDTVWDAQGKVHGNLKLFSGRG